MKLQIFFVNTGVVVPSGTQRRNWEACYRYGFLSAGYGARFRDDICKLKKDHLVAAYTSKTGYVAMGRVKEEAVRIRDFRIQGRALHHFLTNPPTLVQPGLFDREDDEKYSEYVVSIKWLTDLRDPLWFSRTHPAFFAPITTVTELTNEMTKVELFNYFNPQI